MANPLPQKIIFTSNTTTSSGSQQPPSLMAEPSTTTSSETGSATTSSETIQPRLIPPSEIQELGLLPSNMFVTSVDVESGMWDEHLPLQKKQQQDKKKKQKNLNNNNNNKGRHSATTDSSQKDINFDENGQFDDAHDDTLPYFDTDVQNTTTTTTTTQAPSSLNTTLKTSRLFDWDRVESLWEEWEVLEKLEQLVVGCLVGWKVC